MLTWDSFVKMLGCSRVNAEFIQLSQEFNELPNFEESVLGDRKYYSFLGSGILFLLEDDLVDQIFFYTEADEGFCIYRGELPVPRGCSESEIINLLGEPAYQGGGNADILLGYVNKWMKYERKIFSLHLQFNKNDVLCRVTLMK